MRNGEVSQVTSILQSVFPESDNALCGLNADGCLTWANEAFEVLVNRRREDMLGSPLAGLFESAEQRGLAEVFARVLLDGERISGHQTRLRRADGGTDLVQVSGMPVAESGDDTTVVVALEWVPEEQRPSVSPIEADHGPGEPQLPPVLVQTRIDGVCIHVGANWRLLTGMEAETQLGRSLISALHPEHRLPELISVMTQYNGKPCTWRGRVYCNGIAGASIPAMLQATQLINTDGRFAGVSACFRQLPATAVEATSEVRDAVSQYRLDARRVGQMVYDYDVPSGKVRWSGAILQMTGERPERFRGTDLNGWEQRIHPEDRPLIMERLRQALESGSRYRARYRLKRRGDDLLLRVEERATVLRDARGIAYRMLGTIQLLSASDTPRPSENAYGQYTAREALAEEELGWVERISRALRNDRFRLYHQRTFRLLETEEPDRSEILLRMLDEQGEPLAASTFLPPAMRCNLMPLLDRWVIRQVCATLAERDDPSLSVSVNLAPGSLTDGSFASFVERQLKENGLDASVLAFEIVESAVTTSEAVTDFMRHMRNLGSPIILDNVGSGLCSLGYLRGLPVDTFKVDGSFMRHMMDDPVDLAIVESIAGVAKAMNVSLMVQGVEDRRTLEVLRSLDVQTVQGIILHAPEPWV